VIWNKKGRGVYILDKRLSSLIGLMTPMEQKELYVMLKQMMMRRAEMVSWDMTADLMRELMKKEKM
jgi:hypothetical protein